MFRTQTLNMTPSKGKRTAKRGLGNELALRRDFILKTIARPL